MHPEDTRDYHTWRWLWAHAAQQIIASIAIPNGYERVAIGYGWAIRPLGAQQALLLLYPSGEQHAAGDLSLMLAGQPGAVLPRNNQSYPEYVAQVAQIVASCLADAALTPGGRPAARR